MPLDRLARQGLLQKPQKSPLQVVERLLAVQAQDYLGSLWALGVRSQATEKLVEEALQRREIVRSWPMRGTLHLVAAADLRWLLKLLTGRILQKSRRRHQQLGLDEKVLAQAEKVLQKELAHGPVRRDALMECLEKNGIATGQQRGYHILFIQAQRAQICFGPRQGKQHTLVLLDDWLPPTPTWDDEKSLAELARRYFRGHGPATLQDLSWWSGLNLTECRRALELAGPEPDQLPEQTAEALLLPPFDELLLGYRDRTLLLSPEHADKVAPGGNGLFKPIMVYNGRVCGTWSRQIKGENLTVELQPFGRQELRAFDGAAGRYAKFLNKNLHNTDMPSSTH